MPPSGAPHSAYSSEGLRKAQTDILDLAVKLQYLQVYSRILTQWRTVKHSLLSSQCKLGAYYTSRVHILILIG